MSFPKQYGEYKLDVSHIQTLAQLRVKLQRAESLLESSVDVASIISEHAKEMSTKGVVSTETNHRFQSELQQYILRQRCHVRNVKKHMAFSEDIRVLVSHMCSTVNALVQVANALAPGDVDFQNYGLSK